MPKIMRATLTAFLPDHNTSIYERYVRNGNEPEAVNALAFATCDIIQGWVKLGTADITVTVLDEAEFTNARISALKEQKTRLQAETQLKINELDHKIQELLCIEAPKEEGEEHDFW